MIKKCKQVITALKDVLRNPYLLNLVLNRNERWRQKTENDFSQHSLPRISYHLFSDKEFSVPVYTGTGGGSSIFDYGLLMALCSQFQEPSYFEIGKLCKT